MKPRILLSLFFALIAAIGVRPSFAQSARVALLIGNAAYPDAEAPLKQPTSDAKALADELRRLGYDVETGDNLSKEAMQRTLERYYGKIKSGSTALIFFSGYGIQSNRQSYLVPVNAQIWSEADVRRDGFSLDAILAEMNTKGARVKIAILDASRRNPFERRFRSVSAGLAPITAPNGTLAMSAAAPGAVVDDSGSNAFMEELLKQLREPRLTAEEVFNRTRMGVSRASKGQQVPALSSTLGEEFTFAAAPSSSAATASPPPAISPPPVAKPEAAAPPRPTVAAPAAPAPAPAKPAVDEAKIRDLDRVILANRNDGSAYYRRGQLYAMNGDYSRAIQDFDEAIRLDPNDAEAFNNRCWARAVAPTVSTGAYTNALNDCDEALRIRPQYADALDSRGLVNLKFGLPSNAIADYDAALRINPRQASALYGRGIAKLRSGSTASGNSDIAAAKSIQLDIADTFASYGLR